ncbi:MAG TPA: serine/threonine-protein kinase [Gemmatimonadales bacterium]|nr:serine/threonine-protein kinase [Gemmatimonadales bacterium]
MGPGLRDARLREALQRGLGDGYELGVRLGQGGYALVYEATDSRLKRRVAVKVLREDLGEDTSAAERFRREAEAVAALRHPHIIPIYGVGESDGLTFFIMPLVDGGSLADRLAREPRVPTDEARRILREAAHGLAAAHRAGIVHRDIKPDNILLDGSEARVILTDFGIAKALSGGRPGLTETGAVIGTPHYMSPEQASGEAALDPRADIYSLGVVGFQLLTGAVPFNGPTLAAVLVQHLTADVPPIARARPDCPPALAAAVMRCLAKSPHERWASAADLADALEAVGAAPAADTRVSQSLRASRGELTPVRRFRYVLAGCASALVTLVVADVLTHHVLLGPLAFLIGGFVVAAEYGRLWTAGFTWRNVLSSRSAAPRAASPVPLDSLELGPHREPIHRARGDRAAMLAVIQRLPRAERERFRDALSTTDALLVHIVDIGRRLHTIERQIEPGPETIARRLAETRTEPTSPGREQRIVVLEGRLAALQRLEEDRQHLADELSATLSLAARIRAELDRSASLGGGTASGELGAALAEAQRRLD